MERAAVRLMLLLMTVAATAGCGSSTNVAPRSAPVLRIVHGLGTSSPFTAALERALADSLKGVQISVRGTNTNVTNLFMLQRGEADVVFTFADVAYLSSVGQLPGMSERFSQIRAIAELPPSAFQVIVPPGSPVRSLQELRGRHVSLGPPGSSAALTSAFVLRAYDISLDDLTAERLDFAEGAQRVSNGDLDAAFWNGNVPNTNISGAISHGARLLDVSGPTIDRFRSNYPFLKPTVIPAGTYPGIDHPTHSVGIDSILICRSEMNETLAHDLTQALFAIVDHRTLTEPIVRINPSRAASTAIPLHPGAARYYRERELMR